MEVAEAAVVDVVVVAVVVNGIVSGFEAFLGGIDDVKGLSGDACSGAGDGDGDENEDEDEDGGGSCEG